MKKEDVIKMAIKTLKIEGFRGFSTEQEINFAIPDGKTAGSGLTIMVGPNNSGKSTVIEAVHILNNSTEIVSNSMRNIKNQNKIKLEMINTTGDSVVLKTTENLGAFVERSHNGNKIDNYPMVNNIFVLNSKRSFSSTFYNNGVQEREHYKGNVSNNMFRPENNSGNNNFGGRLLKIYNQDNRKKFDECLAKVFSKIPNWTIEAGDNNTMFLEFSFNEVRHSSNGAGDGYINIFNIIDSIYDAKEDNIVFIDEPEISLHPDLQKNLFRLLIEQSKNKQIIISTHSPYFINWELFSAQSKLIRFVKNIDDISVHELTHQTKNDIKKLIYDTQKPHILGLDANEIFFLNDNIILTEGQDDVICYKKIFDKYKFYPEVSFFGWGAGGTGNIEYILSILEDLGYKKVFTIIDNNEKEKIELLKEKFKKYEFESIPTDDVRTKFKDGKITVEGLISDFKTLEINPKYEIYVPELITKITNYFVCENINQDKIEQLEVDFATDSSDEELNKANNILNEYLKLHSVNKYIKKKFPYLDFKSGGGGILSFKKVKRNIYYVIIEESHSLSESYTVSVQFHLKINTTNEKIKLIKKRISKNTLPK